MKFKRTIAFTIILMMLAVGIVAAQDTLLINYQGHLTDNAGDPITGTLSMTFTIYDARAVSKWSEEHSSVEVTTGLFAVILGSQTALPDSVFNGEDRYLGIIVEGGDELSPRTLLTSVPGAAVSRRVIGDIVTGPGMVLVKNAAGDSAVVLAADADVHAMRLYPHDPCGAEPCLPAIEIQANTEPRIDLYYPGGEEEIGIVQLGASAEAGAFISVHNADPQCAEGIRLSGGVTNTNTVTMFGGGHEMEYKLLEMTSQTDVGSSIKLIPPPDDGTPSVELTVDVADMSSCIKLTPPPDDGKPGIELTVDAVTSTSTARVGSPPPDDNKPAIELATTLNSSVLTVQGEDPSGGSAAPQIIMSADAVAAKLGIGTDSLVEALTVMGNGWFSGDMYIMTTTKAKRNIVPIDEALEKVSRMNGYYYDCRTDEYPDLRMPEDRQIGFLAEEVNEVVPEAVGENEYGLTGVSYSRLTALLVEAVKELRAENEDLRLRIERLESR